VTLLTSLPLQLYWTLGDKSRPPNTLITINEESLLLSERKQRSIREVMIDRLRLVMMISNFGYVEPLRGLYPSLLSLSLSLKTLLGSLKYEWMMLKKFRGKWWRIGGSFQELAEERACLIF